VHVLSAVLAAESVGARTKIGSSFVRTGSIIFARLRCTRSYVGGAVLARVPSGTNAIVIYTRVYALRFVRARLTDSARSFIYFALLAAETGGTLTLKVAILVHACTSVDTGITDRTRPYILGTVLVFKSFRTFARVIQAFIVTFSVILTRISESARPGIVSAVDTLVARLTFTFVIFFTIIHFFTIALIQARIFCLIARMDGIFTNFPSEIFGAFAEKIIPPIATSPIIFTRM